MGSIGFTQLSRINGTRYVRALAIGDPDEGERETGKYCSFSSDRGLARVGRTESLTVVDTCHINIILPLKGWLVSL